MSTLLVPSSSVRPRRGRGDSGRLYLIGHELCFRAPAPRDHVAAGQVPVKKGEERRKGEGKGGGKVYSILSKRSERGGRVGGEGLFKASVMNGEDSEHDRATQRK